MSKSVLITGCSSGIGLCTAQFLHQHGYQVFAAVRKSEDQLRLQASGLISVLLDVNDSTSIQNGIAEVLSQTNGRLDALVNNAGFGVMGAVEDLTRESLRAQFETNVFGLHELTRQVIPVMRRQQHGCIINISSVLGLVSMAYRGAYSASKYAVEALSDSLRLELRGTGIHVVLVEPGPIVSHFRQTASAVTRENIDMTASTHRKIYEDMLERQQQQKDSSRFTLGPEAVAKKILHALESPQPKLRYFVTLPTYLLATLRRLLPAKWLDRILVKL
jgi:short-subunit dehydrogenase